MTNVMYYNHAMRLPPAFKRHAFVAILALLSLPVSALTTAFDYSSVGTGRQTAIFAGGCFWTMEVVFEAVNGVERVISGYTGGIWPQPTERQVLYAATGHQEAVLVVFQPDSVSYAQLLEVYWRNIDPEDKGGQFCDRGNQYKSVVFTQDPTQRRAAIASRNAVARLSGGMDNVQTEVRPAGTFWVAEEHHQDYYRKQPFSYRYYLERSGRSERLEELWRQYAGRETASPSGSFLFAFPGSVPTP